MLIALRQERGWNLGFRTKLADHSQSVIFHINNFIENRVKKYNTIISL